MAAMPSLLDLDVAKKLYENMKAIVDMEVSLRMAVIEKVSSVFSLKDKATILGYGESSKVPLDYGDVSS